MKNSFFTRKIRTLRKDAGYTQDYVSRKLKIQRQTYSNYESGKRTPPLEVVVALAALYHLPVDALLHDQFTIPPSYISPALLRREFCSLSCRKQNVVFDFIQLCKHLPD